MQNYDISELRHSCQHIMAQAICNLFPGVKMAMGPATEDGFYGDFDFPEGVVLSIDDLPKIEAEMKRIIETRVPLKKEELSVDEARQLFKDNPYKQEWLDEIEKRGENVTVYWTGDQFVDLCRGPHVGYVSDIKAFKLLKVAGAYWHGDSKNKMLTRVYGTAFPSKQELSDYLNMLEEAAKRDHRKIGAAMDLFHFEPEYAPGSVFWHDKGARIYRKMIEYMRRRQENNGYEEVITPAVMDRCLWETSGHWDKYGAHNYSGKTEDDKMFCIKPMNCPGGLLVYKQGIKSYRDLPLRMAEFGKVHRYEASGSLMGIMRVREFTQDDAHIFCTTEQMEDECMKATRLIFDIYKDFGFENVRIKLSTRPDSVYRIGSDEIWDISEKALANALEHNGYAYELNPGEGAFYGPKLEFVLKDAIGRDWQCGTIQMDMNLPERFDISYIGEDGQKHRPVMLHRALFGSIERFMGILIENCAGKLPLWLSPQQVVVCPVVSEFNGYADEIVSQLRKAGLTAVADQSAEKISYKIRQHSVEKIPLIVIVGAKEAENKTVTIRRLGVEKQETMSLDDFVKTVSVEAQMPSMDK